MRRFAISLLLVGLVLPSVSAPANAATGFEDVPDTHTFAASITWLADVGVTLGCNPPANTRFCPNDPVTRGQMAAFLVRAFGYTDQGTKDFTDDDGHIFEASIERLAAAEVTLGCNPPANTRFCPNDPVTRGQMAAFLVRAFGYTDQGTKDFTDDDGHIFEASIERLAAAEVTLGCNPPANTRFCPNDPVTRGQMAAFLQRALGDTLVPSDTNLVDLELVARRTIPQEGGFELGGRTYSDSIKQDTANLFNEPDYAEYLLGRAYTNFCAVVGVWDTTGDDEEVDAEITLDGDIVWNEVITLGTPVAVDIPVTDALRIRLSIREAVVDSTFVEGVWGSPVVAKDGNCDVPTGVNPATPSFSYLADLDSVTGDAFLSEGAVQLDSSLYSRSIIQTTSSKLDNDHRTTYYLGRDHTRFCAVAGVPDDISDANATADLDILADGVSIGSATVSVGSTTTFSLDVSGVLRLELITSEGGTPSAFTEAGWGNARITKTTC